jgi:citrate lyase subunit beta / citryl-CoA lyase
LPALLRRSILLVPVTDRDAIATALGAGADAICLDLEDTVPLADKQRARARAEVEIARCAEHAQVLVRINADPDMAARDLEACMRPGLAGVRMPKAEEPEAVRALEQRVQELEQAQGIPSGTVGLSLIIESVRGLFASRLLAAATSRLESISLGHEDYARDLGVEATAGGDEARLAQLALVLVAREAGGHPLGSLGRQTTHDGVLSAARWLRSVGFRGAATTDPAVVPLLNETFSPSQEELHRARRITEAYAAAEAEGRGIFELDGIGMVDLPVAQRAGRLLDEAARIDDAGRPRAGR